MILSLVYLFLGVVHYDVSISIHLLFTDMTLYHLDLSKHVQLLTYTNTQKANAVLLITLSLNLYWGRVKRPT